MRTSLFGPHLALLALGACSSAFGDARREDTIFAYRAFLERFPEDSHAEEARRREAELVFAELGEAPGEEQLDFFLQRYPTSPLTPLVEMKLRDLRVDARIRSLDPAAVDAALREASDPVERARLETALGYFDAVRRGFAALDPTPFRTYLRGHLGSNFEAAAREGLDWVRRANAPQPKQVHIEIPANYPRRASAAILERLTRHGLVPLIARRGLEAELAEGELGYRLVTPGDEISIDGAGGERRSVRTPRDVFAAQALISVGGRLSAYWTGLALFDDRPVLAVFDGDPTRAIIGRFDFETTTGGLATAGANLLVATPRGLVVVDPALPHFPRATAVYDPRERGDLADARYHLAASGPLLASFGDGMSISEVGQGRARLLSSVRPGLTGPVNAGAWVGDTFYFGSSHGLWRLRAGAAAPQRLSKDAVHDLIADRGALVVTAESGLARYAIGPRGELGAREALARDPLARRFVERGPVVMTRVEGRGLLMLNGRGEALELLHGRATAVASWPEVVGVHRMVASERRLVLLAGTEVHLLRAEARGWSRGATLPLAGCADASVREPFVYLSCDGSLLVVHAGVFDRGAR